MEGYQVVYEKSPAFYDKYERKAELKQQTHYCPGCGHGIAHKLIAEALTELGVQDNAILVSPVGLLGLRLLLLRCRQCPGRARSRSRSRNRVEARQPAFHRHVLSGRRRPRCHRYRRDHSRRQPWREHQRVLHQQLDLRHDRRTDGADHASRPGEHHQPWGRRANNEGLPLHVAELLASLETPTYIERVALCDMKNINKAKKAVKKALEIQKNGGGFSLVEMLSPCPTIMKMDPVVARKWVADTLVKAFPLGVFRDRKPELPESPKVPHKTVAEALNIDINAAPETAPSRRHHTREVTVKFAGFGGQGVLLMGQLLAEMGLREQMEVSWLPSYGPEMRSGSAHCHVTLSHERIGTPLISRPEVLVAMNELSLRKFAPTSAPVD